MKTSLKKDEASGLSYREVLSLSFPPQKIVALLHGYGASADDLAGLSQFLDPERKFLWLFPQGPLTLSFAYGWTGYSWFPFDLEKMMQAFQTGRLNALELEEPPGLKEARGKIKIFLNEKTKTFPDVPLVFGGFSQGGMIALETFLEEDLPCNKLLLFSTTLLAAKRWSEKALKKKASVFLSHGRNDPVLPFQQAERLKEHLKNLDVEFFPFQGAHEIPPPVLERARHFLNC